VTGFDALAGRYDELRPAGAAWSELTDLTLDMLGPCRRLLDIGCGTGRFAVRAHGRLGGRVWGVDASPEMLAQARGQPGSRGIGWRLGEAERLPFRDGWFDGAHMHLVVHLLPDRPAALAEAARVLQREGRMVIATFRLEHITRFYLVRYFPGIERVDLERFPDPELLAGELRDAGFAEVEVTPFDQHLQVDPDVILERVRGRYISTLHLLGEKEYQEGLERLEQAMAGRTEPVDSTLRWALVRALM
jgi:SAM-dependent methyltransferase